MKRVAICGAGGHGRVVLDILLQSPCLNPVGFLDSNFEIHGRRVDGLPVFGDAAAADALIRAGKFDAVVVAIGDNDIRRTMARDLDRRGVPLISAIHPSATLATNANIGRNTVIAAGVVVCAHCQIADSVILNTGCIVDHQTTVGEGCHICPGARIGGRVHLEAGTFVGLGATVVPNVTIHCEAIIGAGSVVIEDVPPMATVVGVPARPIKLAAATEDQVVMLLPALDRDAPRACQPLASTR